MHSLSLMHLCYGYIVSTTFKNLYYFDLKIHIIMFENSWPQGIHKKQKFSGPKFSTVNSHENVFGATLFLYNIVLCSFQYCFIEIILFVIHECIRQ